MRRADQEGGAIRRVRRSGFAVLGVLLSALVVAGPASAESPPAAPGRLPRAGVRRLGAVVRTAAHEFHLRASNGYKLSVLAATDRKTGKGSALVFVEDRKSAVLYSTRAVVTDTSIEADLGAVGRIDVDFVPSGKPKTERSKCGGKPITFEGGRWVGVIDFEGEQGYSEVHATSARSEPKFLASLVCAESTGGSEGRGGHSPGARLTVQSMGRAEFQFIAMKNSPSRPARFAASVREDRGGVSITRSVETTAPPRAFAFDTSSGVATVNPPSPFSGNGEYRRRKGGDPTWRGDLSVDFPGRRNVRLTGGSAHASLERAVLNPGHPF